MSIIDDIGNRLFKRESRNSTVSTSTRHRLDRVRLEKLDYETSKIILTDTQVAVGYDILKYLLSSKSWIVTGGDEEARAFIEEMFNNLDTELNEIVKYMVSAILYGFSVGENIYDLNTDGLIVLKDVLPIHIKTLQNDPFVYDEEGNLIAIHQEWDGDAVDIPISKVLKYTFNDRFNTDYGNGVLQDFKPIIEDKLNINQWLMNFLEKFESPTLMGKTDDFNRDYLINALNNVSDGLTNVVVGLDDDVDVLESSHRGETFFSALQFKDNQIFRRLYLGNLLLGDNSQTGTYAQSQTQFEFGQLVFDGILEEIANCIQKQIINPIIEANYGNKVTSPVIAFDKFTQGDYSKLLTDLKPLIDNTTIDIENQTIQEIISQYINLETGLDYETTEPEEPEQEDYPPTNEDLTNTILTDINAIE